MTWFLDQGTRLAGLPQPLDTRLPSMGEQFSLGMTAARIENNSWGRKQGFEADLATEMARALGSTDANDIRPQTPDEWKTYGTHAGLGGTGFDMTQFLVDRMAQLQQFDPGRVGNLPTTRAAFDAEVTRRRQAELDETRKLMGAGDAPITQAIGGFAGQATDETQLPFLALGGPEGGVLWSLGREAALGALGAAATIPKQQTVAADLGTEAPDVGGQIATGAGIGLAFGAAGQAIGAGLRYAGIRRAAEAAQRPAGVDPLDHGGQIDRTQAALQSGDGSAAAPWKPNPAMAPFADPAVQNLKRLVMQAEGAGYDTVYGGSVLQPPRPLTRMSVDDVLQWQAKNNAAGSPSSAAGAFQIMPETLRWLKQEMHLTGGEPFDQDLQDRMFVALAKRRGLDAWRAGSLDNASFGNQLAQEWASLPVLDGAGAGLSHYEGDGLNHATISSDAFAAALGGENVVPALRPRPGSGLAGAIVPGDATVGLPGEVVSPAGTRVPVRYEVLDLSALKPATGDLQPRDRSQPWSAEQIHQIAATLDPARLMPSPEADRGAPIVGPDGIVESGNGRVAAIARAVTEHPDRYAAYEQAVRDAFPVPQDVQHPVLVARRTGDMTLDQRLAWVRENNTAAVARMASPVQARADAGWLTGPVWDAYQPGAALTAPENAPFLRGVLAAFPQAERAAMYGADGRINAGGLRRIREALFARAFDAPDLLRAAAEGTRPQTEALLRLLQDVAPDWAAFRAMIDAGYVRPEFDLTAPLLEAARLIARLRGEGTDGQGIVTALREALAQGDLFGGRDPLTEAVIGAFYKGGRARPAEATREILGRYMTDAAKLGRADMADLLDGAVTPRDVLQGAIDAFDRKEPFAPAPLEATAAVPAAPLSPPSDYAEGARSPAAVRADDLMEERLTAAPAKAAPDGAIPPPETPAMAQQATGPAPLPDDVPIPLTGAEDAADRTLATEADLMAGIEADRLLTTVLDTCRMGRR